VNDIQTWLDNPASNFGWILISRSEEVSQTARRFGSREDIANAPQLTIEFTTSSVNTPPKVTQQPKSQTVVAGTNATFSAIASGTEPIRFQWRSNGTDILGATNATLQISNVQQSDIGTYTVVVSNSAGSDTSSAAILTLLEAPLLRQVLASPDI